MSHIVNGVIPIHAESPYVSISRDEGTCGRKRFSLMRQCMKSSLPQSWCITGWPCRSMPHCKPIDVRRLTHHVSYCSVSLSLWSAFVLQISNFDRLGQRTINPQARSSDKLCLSFSALWLSNYNFLKNSS